MLFRLARRIFRMALTVDDGLRIGYQANVAMLLYDRYNNADFSDHDTRNKAANDILNLVFDAKYRALYLNGYKSVCHNGGGVPVVEAGPP